MPSNRVKINVNDEDGNKITISFEGKITRNKVLQVLDFVEILGGVQTANEEKPVDTLSKFDKIQHIIQRKFPVGWFTSQEVMVAYEDAFDEPVGPSTVSTYLSRLVEKSILTRSGSITERKYKMKRIITSNEERRVQS